jgi:hypothetical protein
VAEKSLRELATPFLLGLTIDGRCPCGGKTEADPRPASSTTTRKSFSMFRHQNTTVWTNPGYAFFGQVFAVLICVHIVLQRIKEDEKKATFRDTSPYLWVHPYSPWASIYLL